MRTIARSLAGAIAIAAAATAAAAAQGQRCTHDTFSVDGAPLRASFCVPDGASGRVTLAETFSRGDRTFAQTVAVDAVAGAAVTRTLQDVALAPLGIAKELHLQIAYRNGEATLEHALLLPGAVVLK